MTPKGFCPLCDGELLRYDIETADRGLVRSESSCEACGQVWWLDTSLGRPALRTFRALTKDEIQTLYNREGGGS